MKTVQLYSYDENSYDVIKNKEQYFVTNFNPKDQVDKTFWLNFHSLVDKTDITKICENLSIDKLIVESIFTGTKRPRIEEYADYVFFSIHSALIKDPSKFELKKEKISFVIGDNFLISFQERSSDHFPEVRQRIESGRGKIRSKGPDFLLYRLLEAIIDNYIEVVESISDTITVLDNTVLRNPQSSMLKKVEWEKRKLVDLRKTVIPMRELLVQVDRIENKLIIDEHKNYFIELKDTCTSLIDEIDAQTKMLEGVANLYFASQGQRMNEIMKVLTVTSAIFIPLTFLVGVYGMNFEFMPELTWEFGYLFAWILMVIIAVVLLLIFWKKGWLKRDETLKKL
jgi:magnesium transporter